MRRGSTGHFRRMHGQSPCILLAAPQAAPLLQAERVEGLGARGDDHALRLEVELERVEPELTAETGLLVAAERNAGEGGVRHVDADRAGLDPPGETMPAPRVAGPDGRHQAVTRVVRDPDRK